MGQSNSHFRAESFRSPDRHSENHQMRLASLGGELMMDRGATRYNGRDYSNAHGHLPQLIIHGDDRYAHVTGDNGRKHNGSTHNKSHDGYKTSDSKPHVKGHGHLAHEKANHERKNSAKHESNKEHADRPPSTKSAEKENKPAEKNHKPAEKEHKPAERDLKPADNEHKPAETEHKPARQKEEQKPVKPAEVLPTDSTGAKTVKASWYDEGTQTANQERFKPDGLTVAHKSLPFGTLLEVKNPDNGNTVVVRVNDRGPFVKGRELDLSRGAARQLGMLKKGVGDVEYKVVDHV
jgi:rare lipoprotein A